MAERANAIMPTSSRRKLNGGKLMCENRNESQSGYVI